MKCINIAGVAWQPIKTEGDLTYYLMDGVYRPLTFGKTNNYAESKIREVLNQSELAQQLKEELGDRLVSITSNLASLDGFDDYGTVSGDILSIPTFDLYRECRKAISNVSGLHISSMWWLATPKATPSNYDATCVMCVDCYGRVSDDWCNHSEYIRPFFIVKS